MQYRCIQKSYENAEQVLSLQIKKASSQLALTVLF
jgi:hypothetical protein